MHGSAKPPVRPETERMKWVVVWVAVFLGSVVVFVAIPTPALYWVANFLDVFGDGSAPTKTKAAPPAPLLTASKKSWSRNDSGSRASGRTNVEIQKSTPTMDGASSNAAKAHGTIAIHRATYFTRSIASPSA